MDWKVVITSALVGAVTSLLTAALQSRQKIDDTIREKRLESYRELWEETKVFPRWPPAKVTYAQVRALSETFRDWYFQGGGIYLSRESQAVYGATQEMLDTYREKGEGVLMEDYETVREQLSALRTAFTVDLMSRTRAWTFGWRTRRNA